MDLKHLMNMREEISGLSGKRHRESDVSWLHGLDLLEQAAAGGYRHKPFLIRAGESFLIAIQHNRRNPDPYVGMAYLYLLTGDQARAIRYLNEAQRVAPSHDNSRLLLAAIVAGQEAAREQSTAVAGLEQLEIPEAEAFASDLPVLGPDQDYDALYDALEQLLLNESKKLMNDPVAVQPGLDPLVLQPVEARLETLQYIFRHLEQQLQILDQEIDTTELQTRMRPLAVMIRRMEQVLRISGQFRDIQQRCAQGRKQANLLYRQIMAIAQASELAAAEQALENLLDECDSLADLLDSIVETGTAIESVESFYQQLTASVETCQDLLDERSELFT